MIQVRDNPDFAAAHEAVELSLQPASDDEILKQLVKLKAKTASKGQAEADMAIELSVYVEELRHYPADVMVAGLHRAGKQCDWFPSWAKLYSILEPMTLDRRNLRRGLISVERQYEEDQQC